MIRCKLCKVAVTKSGVSMFEHIVTHHGVELLSRDPRQLLRLANDPDTRSKIIREVAPELIKQAVGALIGPGPAGGKK